MSALRHEITGRVHFQTADTKASGLQPGGPVQRRECRAGTSESFFGCWQSPEVWQGNPPQSSWKSGMVLGVGFSGIFNEPLSLRVKQGVVTAVGVFVDFAVSYAFKSSGTGQSFAETADAGEHIHELDQGHNSRWGCLPDLRRCLIGAPHQKQKQPVIG